MTRADSFRLLVACALCAVFVAAFTVTARNALAADPIPPAPDPHGPLWPVRAGGAVLPLPLGPCYGRPDGHTWCPNPGPTGHRHRIPPRTLNVNAGQALAAARRAMPYEVGRLMGPVHYRVVIGPTVECYGTGGARWRCPWSFTATVARGLFVCEGAFNVSQSGGVSGRGSCMETDPR